MNFLDNIDINIIKKLIKTFPNDQELGREIRKIYRDLSQIREIPNDQDLGNFFRKKIIF